MKSWNELLQRIAAARRFGQAYETVRYTASALLDMAEDDKGVQIIRHKVSRQDMAKVVGASREMVSRVMKDLEERGVIETQENGSVVIKERLGND